MNLLIMVLGEYLRTLVLNSSILICDTSTTFSFIFEQLLTNLKFLLFAASVIAISLFIFAVVFIKKRENSTKYIFYLFAALIFYTAAILKFSFSSFGYAFGNFDRNVYSSLIGLISDRSGFQISFKQSVLMLFTGLLGRTETSDCELKKLNDKTISSSVPSKDSSLMANNTRFRSFLESNFASDINGLTEKSMVQEKAGLKSIISAFDSDESFATEKKVLIDRKKDIEDKEQKFDKKPSFSDKQGIDVQINDPVSRKYKPSDKANNSDNKSILTSSKHLNTASLDQSNKEKKDIKNQKVFENLKDKGPSPKDKENVVVVLKSKDAKLEKVKADIDNNLTVSKSIKDNPKNSEIVKILIKGNSKATKSAATNLNSTNIIPSTSKDTKTVTKSALFKQSSNLAEDEESSDTRHKDSYFKMILHKINQESHSNKKIYEKFSEIERILDFVEEEGLKLDFNLKSLIDAGAPIEKELKSFNSSFRNLDVLRIEIGSNIKRILKLKKVHENMYINENDAKEHGKHNAENKSNDLYEKAEYHSAATLQVTFFIEALVFLLFLYLSAVSSSYYTIKLITSIILIFNVSYGLILMVDAHFYDKNCMLGKVPDCRPKYSNGFEKFARSANLDLKATAQNINSSTEIDVLRMSLDNLENMSHKNSEILKQYISEDYIGVFRYHKKALDHLLSKLNFVKDDFEDLVHKKVNKTQFYSIIDSIDFTLSQIEIHLDQIEKRLLIEYYTKEAIFLNFISEEKNSILVAVQKELNSSENESKIMPNKNCYKKIERLCRQRSALDFIYFMQIFGALILGVFLIF